MPSGGKDMKRLFVYYSLTGNGDEAAKRMKEKGFDIRKVVEKKKMPKSFFWKMMAGGFRAGINAKGRLVEFDDDISSYDEIIIGSPIWNGRFPPAINGALDRLDLRGKKVSFLLYSGSGEGKHALKKIKRLFPDSKALFLREPKKYPEQFDKLDMLLD